MLGILALEFFHPEGTLLGSVAQFGLYAAILGPVFWVGRASVSARTVERLFLVLWAFYTASAALGVLQTYFPGQFQPALSSVIAGLGKGQLAEPEIEAAGGEHIFRPNGFDG